MKDQLNSTIGTVKDRWVELSLVNKVLVGTLTLTLVFVTLFFMLQANDDYEVLYADMSLPDAAATVRKLDEMKVPYRVENDGTTIMVPRSKKSSLILETANELTSEKTVSLSEIPPVVQGDIQREWIRKMNTDAIVKTLQSINGIRKAQVIVSQPTETVFTEREDEATASVLLMVEPGYRLQENLVKTIKNLVSHAVPGLRPENVAIADNQGNSLEEGIGKMLGSTMSTADYRRKKFEDETRRKILNLLLPIVGPENAVVSVSAVLNMDQTQAKIHKVVPLSQNGSPPTGLVVSQQLESEEYASKQDRVGGAPGADANTAPTYQAVKENDQNGNYKMNKQTTNFAHTEENKEVVYAPGAVERMTISVVLNKVLTTKETEEIRDAVASAAGSNFERGDSVVVKGFQFSQAANQDESILSGAVKVNQEYTFWIQIAYIVSAVVLGLAAIILFYFLLRKPAEGELMQEENYREYGYLDGGDEDDEMLPNFNPDDVPMIAQILDPEVETMREAINKTILQDPTEAARILMTYIKEG